MAYLSIALRGRTGHAQHAGRLVGLPKEFLTFLAGLTVSKLGDGLYTFALPWIAYELTGSPLVMGTLLAVEILPIPLLGVFAGAYVDRFDRRKLMLSVDAVRAALVASIPSLQMFGVLQIWYLYAVAFSLALVSMAFDVSTAAAIPQMAGANLTKANAAHQMALQVASLAGPALAGLAVAAIGGFQALWLVAISFGGTFLTILQMQGLTVERCCEEIQGVLKGIAEGFRWFRSSRPIQMLALQASFGNFGDGMSMAVLMYYLRDTMGLAPEVIGGSYAMLGLGGITGSLAIVPLARHYRRGTLYPVMLSVGVLSLVLVAVLRTWWAPGLGFGILAACDTAWVVLSTSVRQELIPGHLFGRVLSFSRLLSTAAMPLGAALGGLLIGGVDPVFVFLIAATLKGVEVGIARFSVIHRL